MAKPGSVLDQAARLIGRTPRIYVLTGEGLSAESGVPPMLDDTRLFRDNRPSWLATRHAFQKDPQVVWDWYGERRKLLTRYEPNDAHKALAECEAVWDNLSILTESTDGLHEEAGTELVYSLRGSVWHNRCTNRTCKKVRRSRTKGAYQGGVPISPCCGAHERPDVLWPDDPESRLLTSFDGPTTREKKDLALVVGEGVVPSGLVGRVVDWRQVIEIHEGKQNFPHSLFIQAPARGELRPLLRAAEAFRR